MTQIPTIEFDTSRLTYTVLAELEAIIRSLPEVEEQHFDEFYDLALRAIAGGGDMNMFSTGIMAMSLSGMTARRAAQISSNVWFRTTAMMEREQLADLGITRARWLYSRAPCMLNPKAPTQDDLQRDAAHKAADRRVYVINEGLVLNGKQTWPGHEDGCNCSSMPVIPGFEE